jgi:hypothetical protein
MIMETASRERAVRTTDGKTTLRATRVKDATGTRTMLLPDDPHEVAKILRERRAKSPAAKVRARMYADIAKRTGK